MRLADRLYAEAFHRVLFPAWESGIRRRATLRHLAFLERSQWWSADRLATFQAEALARLVTHARENVPYYGRVFAEHGVTGRELAEIPVLTREAARDATDERRSVAGPRVEIAKQTSGTQGRPLVFGYDRGSEHWRQAAKHRGYGWAGYRLGTPVLFYWGHGAGAIAPPWRARAKVAVDHALRRETWIDCGRRGEAELDACVAAIRRVRPRTLLCYAQAAVDLARHVLDRGGRDWDDIPVIVGAEPVVPGDRQLVERALGPLFETYGSRETMLLASECEAHDGLHQPAENILLEVVVRDGDRVRAAAPGELGEVCVTDLHNYGMPFLRYLNGDLAVAMPPGTCACGRALPRLRSVEGRVNAMLRDAQGRKVHGLSFLILMAGLGEWIRRFQLVQHKDGAVTYRLVAAPLPEAALGQIRATQEKYLPGLPYRIDYVDDIPTTASGKRQVVVVEA